LPRSSKSVHAVKIRVAMQALLYRSEQLG